MLERQRGTLLLSGATMSLRGGPNFSCMAPVKAQPKKRVEVSTRRPPFKRVPYKVVFKKTSCDVGVK